MLIANPSGARRVFTNWYIGTFPVLAQIQTHEQEFAVDDQRSLQPSNDYILISTAIRENMPTRKLEPMKHRHSHQGANLSITDISNLGTGHYHPHDPLPHSSGRTSAGIWNLWDKEGTMQRIRTRYQNAFFQV